MLQLLFDGIRVLRAGIVIITVPASWPHSHYILCVLVAGEP